MHLARSHSFTAPEKKGSDVYLTIVAQRSRSFGGQEKIKGSTHLPRMHSSWPSAPNSPSEDKVVAGAPVGRRERPGKSTFYSSQRPGLGVEGGKDCIATHTSTITSGQARPAHLRHGHLATLACPLFVLRGKVTW